MILFNKIDIHGYTVEDEEIVNFSSRLISITRASVIMRISIASTMSSCLNSCGGDSWYMRSSRSLIPSSRLLKSNGGMIPWWPYGILYFCLCRNGVFVENRSISTDTSLSDLRRTLMMKDRP
ncbi:beta V1 [Hedyotis yellow mosaic betasatellite]|uniref:Beta V1 n=1 Tax=Hedyotis yellow mosaic betasatellite TaxID=1428189 RepID=V5RE95_9VIRU|nr:beta V1 [Hedyotis yellow mosaic betasatellite]AHB33493.1 beta V1 [Hedyotis yellow mosaic betasatellite]